MSDRGRLWLRPLAIALPLLILSAGLTLAVGAVWARAAEAPRVTVLGAGNRLSVLVTAGPARLLIATGDDPVAFGNALGQARPLTSRRLDIVLLAGQGRDLAVAAEARADEHARVVATIGPIPADPIGADVDRPPRPVIDAPRRIRLSDDVSVTLDVAVTPNPDADDVPDVAWRAVVRRGATTVVVLSHGDAATEFASPGPVAALVLVAGQPEEALAAIDARALVVNAESIDGRELRQELAPRLADPLWAVRVFSGEAVDLEFVDGGLEIPRTTTQLLGGTPPAGR